MIVEAHYGEGNILHFYLAVKRSRHGADLFPVSKQPQEQIHGVNAVAHGWSSALGRPFAAPWHLIVGMVAEPGRLTNADQWSTERLCLNQVLEVLAA